MFGFSLRLMVFCGFVFSFAVCGEGATQRITLNSGWNAFYLRVAPNAAAGEFFADWPVMGVSFYQAEVAAEPRQFSTDVEEAFWVESPYLIWQRGADDVASLQTVGGGIYLAFNTNSVPFTVDVTGAPVMPRMRWHVATKDSGMLNLLGISLPQGGEVPLVDYLSGLDVGWTQALLMMGADPVKPSLSTFLGSAKVRDGMVLFLDAERTGVWAGPVSVSPLSGLNFGASENQLSLKIANTAGVNQEMVLANVGLLPDGSATEFFPADALHYLTPSNTWANLDAGGITRVLAPGEGWQLVLAVDRQKMPLNAVYGALLRLSAVGAVQTVLDVPVLGQGSLAMEVAWPAGLWVGAVAFNRVSTVVDDATLAHDVPAGGVAGVRLILHVDEQGGMTLLQRVTIASEAQEGAAAIQYLYPGSAVVSRGKEQVRVSSVCLPVESPVIEGVGVFGRSAAFEFTVAEHGQSNPFRHAFHPRHDGLSADFKRLAPSGDDLQNYVGVVKPELFSISNRIELLWDEGSAATAAWNPEESLTGSCTWSMGGLRRQGDLRASGVFTLKRVCRVGELEL